MSELKIWKPTLQALLNEAFQPFYMQLTTKIRSSNVGDMVSWELSVAGWSDEDQLCEWRVVVAGEVPAAWTDQVREADTQARRIKDRVLAILQSQEMEVREGSVSDTPVYGELPEEIGG